MTQQEKLIKDAQYRKGLSIAFFNATNAAIELVKNRNYPKLEDYQGDITAIRDWFLEEHARYYAEVIARVGVLYDVRESIKKLEATQNMEELQNAWIAFSEDERKDAAIIKIKNELKQKHEKI